MANGTADIVSDEEIVAVHGNANFGAMKPRDVVGDTVLKYAFGYSTGHTAMCIAIEHGLASRPRSARGAPKLTKKGMNYLRAMLGSRFSEIKEMARGSA